jgi:tRNA pseudouridine55 synthase
MGTLDPLASGVLIVGIGHGTKLMEWALTQGKTYFAVIRFGWETSTEDIEGVPGDRSDVVPTLTELESVVAKMIGTIQQRPSSISALRVDGKRAYTVDGAKLEPRIVQIYSISIDAYRYPELLLTVRCGRGVYIRALARDIGRACGTCAHLGWLRRIEYAGWWK